MYFKDRKIILKDFLPLLCYLTIFLIAGVRGTKPPDQWRNQIFGFGWGGGGGSGGGATRRWRNFEN